MSDGAHERPVTPPRETEYVVRHRPQWFSPVAV
jgi:hypothetical protein